MKKTVRLIQMHLFALASAGAAKRDRRSLRGVTLVEVMIVVTILAVISGGAVLVAFPMLNEARVKTAVTGCSTVKQAADLFQNLEGAADQCPTIQDLVSSKKIESHKTEDPWNQPFKIMCTEGDIRVISFGKDRKEGTPDDVRDDFRDADIKRVSKL